MTAQEKIAFGGVTPYLYYDDAASVADWLVRVFGFVEMGRHAGADGVIQNIELRVGSQEIWLDGYPKHQVRAESPSPWIGVWVDDVDAMYQRLMKRGAASSPPVDRGFGVRMVQATDPEGRAWGFMKRIR